MPASLAASAPVMANAPAVAQASRPAPRTERNPEPTPGRFGARACNATGPGASRCGIPAGSTVAAGLERAGWRRGVRATARPDSGSNVRRGGAGTSRPGGAAAGPEAVPAGSVRPSSPMPPSLQGQVPQVGAGLERPGSIRRAEPARVAERAQRPRTPRPPTRPFRRLRSSETQDGLNRRGSRDRPTERFRRRASQARGRFRCKPSTLRARRAARRRRPGISQSRRQRRRWLRRARGSRHPARRARGQTCRPRSCSAPPGIAGAPGNRCPGCLAGTRESRAGGGWKTGACGARKRDGRPGGRKARA